MRPSDQDFDATLDEIWAEYRRLKSWREQLIEGNSELRQQMLAAADDLGLGERLRYRQGQNQAAAKPPSDA